MKQKLIKSIKIILLAILLSIISSCNNSKNDITSIDVEGKDVIDVYNNEYINGSGYDFGDWNRYVEINKENLDDFVKQLESNNPSRVYINVRYINEKLVNSIKNVESLGIVFIDCDFSNIDSLSQDFLNLDAKNIDIEFSKENIFSESIYRFIECFKKANSISVIVNDKNIEEKFDINEINFSSTISYLVIDYNNSLNYVKEVDLRKYDNLFTLQINGDYQEVWLPNFKQNMWSYIVKSSEPCIIHVSDNFLDFYEDNYENFSYGNGPAIFVDSSNNVLCIGNNNIMYLKTYKDDLFNKYPSLYDYLDDPTITSIFNSDYFWRGQAHFIGVRNPDDYAEDVLYQITGEPSYIMDDELYASVVNYLESLPIYYNLY